ncbi:glycosyltransferase [Deminuibacter soli]|uniref:Glycosyl transferase n=1 Tax=Deminuibacter soli TaxID=2291815 RepID=A0A3E1NH71_9BACT|nr:nucleotide disphospho-sugar-binding domain-containing protein [Deminuibacter soli]RFM27232.1 glycosyl transferase [Deminuibacter soli]
MAKFLFVVPPFFGHISPTLSVGATLLQRGHKVVWTGLQPLAPHHIPEGGVWITPEEELAPHREAIARVLKRQDDGPNISGAEALKLALEETYAPFCRWMMPGVSRIADNFQPDVIVSDCITWAGAICAYSKGIPYATTTPVPPGIVGEEMLETPKINAWQNALITGLQQEFGIYTDAHIVNSPQLNIVFTSAEFAGCTKPPPHMQFTGPVKGRPNNAPFDWDKLAAMPSPKVYASIGTLLVNIRKEFFSKLVTAFGNTPVTIVAATHPGIMEEWPSNFIVQDFVPQSAVMAQMDAVICHGGFNTVNDTFLHGLPMIITPIAYDQFHTASLIERAGCGIKLRYKRLRIPDLQQALHNVLHNPQYRLAAQRIRETYINAGGNDAAVFHLEQFAAANKTSTHLTNANSHI